MFPSAGSRPARFVAVATLVGSLAACNGWAQVGFGPEHRRYNAAEDGITVDNVATLTATWSTSFPGAVTEPILDEGRVYVGTSLATPPTMSVGARAYDADTGTELWRNEDSMPIAATAQAVPASVALSGGTLAGGGVALVSSDVCIVAGHRFDPDDGSTLSSDTAFQSAAVTAGGLVAHTEVSWDPGCPAPQGGHGQVRLVVRDTTTLAPLWSADLGTANPLTMPLPTIADDHIYVVNGASSQLSAFTAAGCGAAVCESIWTVEPGWLPTTPVAAEDGTVFTVAGGTLYALDEDSGSTLWRASSGSVNGLALANGVLFAAGTSDSGARGLQAYPAAGCGAATCNPTWSAALPSMPTSEPTVAGGVVYVGVSGAVYAFDASGCGSSSCTAVATLPFTGPANHLAVGQGRLVVAGSDLFDLGQGTVHITVFEPPT